MAKFNELTTKKARISYIKEQLKTNPSWAKKAVLRIFEYQTTSEQTMEATTDANNVGFNGADAYILSSFAKQILEQRFVGSIKQMAILHKKMPKYAGQLEKLSK